MSDVREGKEAVSARQDYHGVATCWHAPGITQDEFDPKERPSTWEEDGYTVTRLNARTAPGCHDNCGLLAYVKDGKLVKIEGDPQNPYNKGHLCVRCLALPETVYHPDRLKYPMKRDPKYRGQADKWERISWDEAYDLWEKEWRRIIDTYGAESISSLQGTGRDPLAYSYRLPFAIGSGNVHSGFLSGQSCYLPRMLSTAMQLGDFCVADCSQFLPDRFDDPRWKCPEVILQWGCNTVVSNSDGFLGHWIVECQKRGAKLVTIDPRLTWMAGKSDLWLQIRPGTDGALALAMGHVILEEGLFDQDWVDRWTYNIDKYVNCCREWTPEKAAEVCDLDPDDIRAAARMYANAKPGMIQWGLAIDQQHGGYQAGCAIMDLWILTGNVDIPGGNVLCRNPWGIGQTWMEGWGNWDEIGDPSHGKDERIISMERGAETGLFGEYPLTNALQIPVPDEDPRAAIEGKPHVLRSFMMSANNNMCNMGADPELCYKTLMQGEFNIGKDVMMTPTMQATCDLVLPVSTFVERIGLTGFTMAYLGAMKPVIEPTGEQKTDLEIECEIGRRLAPEAYEGLETEEDVLNHWMRRSGMTYDDIAERTWAYPEWEYRKFEKGLLRADGAPGFNTMSGRLEFASVATEMLGAATPPVFVPPVESPISSPELLEEYPVTFGSGARKWGFFHSEHRWAPSLRRIDPEPRVEIHPETAEKYGIEDGDIVLIENMFGHFVEKARLTPTVRKDYVMADHGWWFPEEDYSNRVERTFEINPNCCVPLRPGPQGVAASYKSTLCKISKAPNQDPAQVGTWTVDSAVRHQATTDPTAVVAHHGE